MITLNPPGGAVALSVDEKTQIQALDRSQPLLPVDFGWTEKRTHDYRRHGTTNLFAALNTATGKVTAAASYRGGLSAVPAQGGPPASRQGGSCGAGQPVHS